MNQVVDELDSMLSNLSINQIDDVITRMEKMKVTNKKDSDVEGLIMAMGSLNTVPGNKKLEIALEGVKKHKAKIFARKYKSLSGRKQNLSKGQIEDIFATLDALKTEEDMDEDDWSIDMDDFDMVGGAKKLKIRMKKKSTKKPAKKPKKKSTRKSQLKK